ncbi:uncharacterized protein [Polyergus mexicanus]|uniref:uncharacterized protein n=1 Tax=Polyergus mexicanus TaxID=615972 RepID=UPI0038B521A2
MATRIKDIEDAKKRSVLLTKVDTEMYNLLRNLAAPTKLNDMTYEEIVKKLKDYLVQPPSEIAEHAKFAMLKQNEGMKIIEFVAELKSASRYYYNQNIARESSNTHNLRTSEPSTSKHEGRSVSLLWKKRAYQKILSARRGAVKNVATTNSGEDEESSEAEMEEDEGSCITTITDKINSVVGRVSKKQTEPQFIVISVNGKSLTMEMDTRSTVSTIPESIRKHLWPKIRVKKTARKFKAVRDSVVTPTGVIKNMSIELEEIRAVGDLYIIETANPLIERPWLKQFKLFPLAGSIYRRKVEIKVKSGTNLVFKKARPLPFALVNKVNKELDKLLEAGVIEPVDRSEWASPMYLC